MFFGKTSNKRHNVTQYVKNLVRWDLRYYTTVKKCTTDTKAAPKMYSTDNRIM